MSSSCMYQGLGQMLTMCLQHHQGCSETPKYAYVIYGQPLNSKCQRNFAKILTCSVLNGCLNTVSSPEIGSLATKLIIINGRFGFSIDS